MTELAPLSALRELLDTMRAVPEIPAECVARASRQTDAMERTLASETETTAANISTRRTLEAVDASILEHRERLHDLTARPGYRVLDALARHLRTTPAPAAGSPYVDGEAAPARDDAVPIAVAVAEWRAILTAAARLDPGDATLADQVDRARTELNRVAPPLAAAEAAERDLDAAAQQLSVARETLAGVQRELSAVRRRVSSRVLDTLHLPARARRPVPKVPATQHELPAGGWPQTPAGGGEVGEPVLALLDLPTPDDVVTEDKPLPISGWAFAADEPVSRIEVVINGTPAGLARLGYVRPDVHGQYQVPHALLSGFDFRCDPAAFQGGARVRIELFATTLRGRRSLIAFRAVWVARRVEWARAAPISPIAVDSVTLGDTAKGPAAPDFHLLVITHDLGYGGGQLWLTELLDRMGAGRDFPCTLVTPQSGPLAPMLRRLGITIHVNGWWPADRADAYEGRLTELSSWATARGFSSALVNTFLSFPGADMATRLGLPCAWAIHESWTPEMFWAAAYPPGGVDPAVKQAALRALGTCAAVVFEAAATRALYARHTKPGAAIVVQYGISTREIRDYCVLTDRQAAREQLGLTGFRRVLLVMGSIEPRKWQTMIALAFWQIASAHPDTALVFVGGGDTPYARGLTDYLRHVGLNQQVRVEPVVADTYPWYRAADALICASDVESLPRSVLEAMAFGLPVAAASVFGLPELITDGETGLLFEGADLQAATAAFDRLLSMSPEELAAIAGNGQRHVLENHDSAGYAARFAELLHEISGRAPASIP